MRIDRHHRSWIFGSAAAALLGAAAFAISARAPGPPDGGSVLGLTFGISAAGCIAFAMLLGLRKRFLLVRVGPVAWWLKGHLDLGLLSLPFALFHGGFRHGGPLTAAIMWLLYGTVLTGVLGALFQHFVPRIMLVAIDEEITYKTLDRRLQNIGWKAARLVVAACGKRESTTAALASCQEHLKAEPGWAAQHQAKELRDGPPGVDAGWIDHGFFDAGSKRAKDAPAKLSEGERGEVGRWYDTLIGPYLQSARQRPKSMQQLASEMGAAFIFENMRARVPNAAPLINELEILCAATRQRIRQARLHALLHSWLLVHIPLSVGLTVLSVPHIYMALRY